MAEKIPQLGNVGIISDFKQCSHVVNEAIKKLVANSGEF